MDALNVATLHCQLQYLNGDTSHARAVKNWASGVLRKADRLSPKRSRSRSTSSSAATREVPAGGVKEPGNITAVEPMSKRLREDRGMAALVELAPVPDTHWDLEEAMEPSVSTTQLDPVLPKRQDSGPGSFQKKNHHPPGQTTEGKDSVLVRGSSPSVGYPGGMSAVEAGKLFPGPTISKTTVRPVIPSLLSIRTGYEPGRFPPPVASAYRPNSKPTARGSTAFDDAAHRWSSNRNRRDSRHVRLPASSEEPPSRPGDKSAPQQ